MKKLTLLTFFVLAVLAASSQRSTCVYDSLLNDYIFTEIVEINLEKDQLFRNAKTWLARNLSDYKTDVDMEDAASGRIITKIQDEKFDERGGYEYLYFTITIDCKDKKYRYKISDIQTGIYIQPTDLHIDNTMKDYIKATNPRARMKGESLKIKFFEIGNSIKSEMSVDDDF